MSWGNEDSDLMTLPEVGVAVEAVVQRRLGGDNATSTPDLFTVLGGVQPERPHLAGVGI